MSRVTGLELGVQLCKMFGLDANNVTGIFVSAQIGELAFIQVDYLIDKETMTESERSYHITEMPE